MRPALHLRPRCARDVAALLLAATVAAPGARAGQSDPALRADVASLHALVERARADVHLHEPDHISRERRQRIDRIVRENAQRRLQRHLVNLSGQPYFDSVWTHYTVEGRRQVAASSRQHHVRACPICNVVLHELGLQTGAALPKLAVPFATVTLGDAYFKVDADSGRIYRIVDPIRGTPSFVSTGRMMLSDGRWWVVNGTQRTGPIQTRGSTRLPWVATETRAATPSSSPSPRDHPPSRTRAPRLVPTPQAAATKRPSEAPPSPRPPLPGWPNVSATPTPATQPAAPPATPPKATVSAAPASPPDWRQAPTAPAPATRPSATRPSTTAPTAPSVPPVPRDWLTPSARSSTPPIPLGRAGSATPDADSAASPTGSAAPSAAEPGQPFWR